MRAALILAKRSGKLKRLRLVPPMKLPRAIERRYIAYLRLAMVHVRVLAKSQIVDRLPAILDRAHPAIRRNRFDAPGDSPLTSAIKDTKREASQIIRVQSTARIIAENVSDTNLQIQNKALRTVLGVQIGAEEPWLDSMITDFADQNARLVEGVTDGFFDSLATAVSDGLRQGDTNEKIAETLSSDFISENGDVLQKTERRLELIARDQVGSLNSDITRVRQTDIGIEAYIWRTSDDERVRASHQERDGLEFTWDTDIEDQLGDYGIEPDDIDGPPGRPVLCRCTAEPKLQDLVDDIPEI